jgi:hypothetical protein
MKVGFVPCLAFALTLACAAPEPRRPTIQSGEPSISYRIGDELHQGTWRLAPELEPDTLEVDLEEGETVEVCFITDVEEFCRATALDDRHDVDIVYDGVAHFNRIEGRRHVPAAVFSDEYIAANTGRITVLIPEAYELVNIAIALTEVGREARWLVVKDSDYYQRMMRHFAGHLDHPFVTALNEQLVANRGRYSQLKMNGHAFEYDAAGELQRSSIYHRTGFAAARDNALLPFFEEMRAFSRDTDFRVFYQRERATYAEQIRFYEEEIDLDAMNAWLRDRFPGVEAYDTVKFVFSPLVGGTQSVTWFVQGDFRELQPHINFPYRRMPEVTPQSEAIVRGAIAFTELNHGYINPTADGYAAEIAQAVTDLSFWADEGAAGNYHSPMAMFNEYMNWAVVGLYMVDHAPAEDHPELLAWLDRFMDARGRGFVRFPEFMAFLVGAYRDRTAGESIADLYPAMIQWYALSEAAWREAESAAEATAADS